MPIVCERSFQKDAVPRGVRGSNYFFIFARAIVEIGGQLL
jgi:hypothetical protein